MRPRHSLDLRARLLSNERIDDIEPLLWKLMEHTVPEDDFLEYKRGDWLDTKARNTTREERNAELRHYISGFANADGGVLIVGMGGGEDRGSPKDVWEVTGCDVAHIGGAKLDDWATDVLHPLGAQLAPFPRIDVVRHDRGPVLIVTTARAPNLVRCPDGRLFYRLGSSTPEISHALHADLVLGRRVHPDLEVHSSIESSDCDAVHRVIVNLSVENRGLAWCPPGVVDVAGYVSPAYLYPTEPSRYAMSVGMLGALETDGVLAKKRGMRLGALQTLLDRRTLPEIAPLTNAGLARVEVLFPNLAGNVDNQRWIGALVLMPRDRRPTFAEIEVELAGEFARPTVTARVLPPGVKARVAYEEEDE